MTHERHLPKDTRDQEFDELVAAKKLGLVKSATVRRLVLDKGYGFLRGDGDNADTFFHVNVVRFTDAEMKNRRGSKVSRTDPLNELVLGMKVLFISAGLSKDGKGARARWVGVGDPGGL